MPYEDLKKYLNEKIDDCEKEREICLNMKPKPLTILAEKNFYYARTFRKILKKVEDIEEKEKKSKTGKKEK